jgi:hypothetical protein
LAFNLGYDKAEYNGEDQSNTSVGFGIGLGGSLPVSDRVYVDLGVGFGYARVSSNYDGPEIGGGLDLDYFLTRNISMGPNFSVNHIFEDPSETDISLSLILRLFFPTKK